MDKDVARPGVGWYISDLHAKRALGYLSAALPELHGVDMPHLAEVWGEALEKTMDPNDPSPIGPEHGRA